MKALVTGGAGFIGSHLSERLLDHGADVRAIDCFTDYYPRPIKEANLAATCAASRLPVRRGAICATPILPALLDGITHVFHLAAQAGVRKSWGTRVQRLHRLNVDATQRLLEACVGRPIERLVYASSSSVYGDDARCRCAKTALPQPVSPYGVTKLAAEQLCHLYYVNYGVPTVSLRYFTVYGPRQRPDMGFNRFFSAILRRPPARAVRRRPANARLHLRRRRRQGDRGCGRPWGARARLQYWWRLPRLPAGGLRPDWPRSGRKVTIDQQDPRRRATCATPTPTRRGRRPTSASRRR